MTEARSAPEAPSRAETQTRRRPEPEDPPVPRSGRASAGRLQFRILGPLEVAQGDQTLSLGGRKQRAVLAHLLVHPNESVSVENLVDAVWGDDPPGSARGTLYSYVSHLRDVLGHDRIESHAPGYRLRLDARDLDAARFEVLLKDAAKGRAIDPRSSAALLEEALGLWRGPALAEVADDGALRSEAARLDELRRIASEERLDALLATGEQARVIADAEALVDRHPLRERIWQQLMLALYREGRQAEALNAYQRVREILADELGIDPSPELVRTHERILRQDPVLELRGEPLRGYRLLEKIDEGPIGIVFRAIQPHVGRDVAVKIFHAHLASDPAFVRRFEREAQAAAALEHPHIVPIYDYWREPGRAYVVSRYLTGGSLAGLEARGQRLEPDRVRSVAEQIGSALSLAHARGIAHGNVTPSNVLFDGEGNSYLGDLRVGIGAASDLAGDIRGFASLVQDLLGARVPASVAELVQRASLGSDSVGADEIVDALRGGSRSPTMAALPEAETRNPFKGLRAFTESDAHDFFGRSELTSRLISRFGTSGEGIRFVAAVGPSGIGKSSVVRAGVVPAIRKGALGDPERVFVAEMFPGDHPIDELEAALVSVSTSRASRLHHLLDGGSRGLLDAMDLVLPAPAELVLVVDQFEEVFTLTTDERERELFLESLRVATADPESRLRVIVTLRADFYDRPLIYPRFGEALAAGTEVVTPITPDETEQAIRRPAEGVGIVAEPGLVAEIVADVAHQPGALPLLQYALTELFERREGDRLTLAAYEEIGGVTGALSARADRIFGSISPEVQRTVKQIFLRLVNLGEGRQDTRRRVTRSELDALEVDTELVDRVVDTYGRHRLLTFDRDPASREPTVEIAHEALLGAWGRLRTWIDDARDDLRQDRQLSRAAGEWRGSERDPSFLLRGARLDQVEAWGSSTDLALARAQREYIKASLDERDREEAKERDRKEHERQLERRSVRRLRGMVAVLAAAALVAATLTVIATNQRERAAAETRAAHARELAAAAVANLESDQQLSVLLAIEAVEQTRSVDGVVLREAEEALHRAVTNSRIGTSIPGSGPWKSCCEESGAIAWGPRGLVVLQGVFASEEPRPAGIVDLRDEETGGIVRSLPGHEGKLTGAAFSPDGSMLATSGAEGLLKVWDLSSGKVLRRVKGPGAARGVTFSADGSRVAAAFGPIGGPAGVVEVLDLSADRVLTFPAPPYVNDVALSPDGSRLVAVGGDYRGDNIHLIDVASGEVQRIPDPESVGLISVAWSPDGRYIAAGGWLGAVPVWDASGELRFLLRGTEDQRLVEWSADSERLLTGGSDGTARIWDVTDLGATQTLPALSGAITGITFSPDGTQAMTRSETRVMDVWDVGPTGGSEVANIPDATQLVSFTPDGLHVTTADEDGSLDTLDLGTGERTHRPIGWFEPPRTLVSGFEFAPDGGSVASFRNFYGITLRDVGTGATLATGWTGASDWSPNGELFAFSESPRGTVEILDGSGRRIVRFRDVGFSIMDNGVVLGPGNLLALAGSYDEPGQGEYVKIWDWRQRELIAELRAEADDDGAIAFNRDWSRFAIGSEDTTVWDVAAERRLLTLSSSQVVPADLAFSPDGARLVEIDPDGTVRLFDTGTGEPLLALDGHETGGELAFSPDGAMLATQGDGIVRIWALDIGDLLEIARQKVTRSLTDEECRQYLHVERCPGS